ncbi:MAG: F0F1 ATP synthase subunit A [Bacteroidales bacterium]|jgi:F-type H+-transporting ATPase subunit a|nr:F0F1 ATP synthase subunit A [Bacteroidales bacterium]
MNYKFGIKPKSAAFVLFFFLLTCNGALLASTEESGNFNPGQFIIDHIIDSYGWHITTIGEHEISVPLPVILIDNGKPVLFMSNRFHHGHAAHRGYAIGFTPETKGKIVRVTADDGTPLTGPLEQGQTYNLNTAGTLIDISITKNVCSLLISIILMCIIFLTVAKQYRQREGKAPKGLQSLLEPVILFIRDEVAIPSIGPKHAKYLPYLLTLFFFILINNLMGLIPIFPGGANLTGNIAITGILALITFLITTFSSNKSYWKHIFNTPGVPWWLKIPLPIMPLVELIGVFTKPFVLMVRLFANITAGHIIVLGFIGLIFIFGQMAPALGYGVSVVSIFFYLFMGLLELIVAFVQAFVFTLLTALYIGMALEEHEEHTAEHIEQNKIA